MIRVRARELGTPATWSMPRKIQIQLMNERDCGCKARSLQYSCLLSVHGTLERVLLFTTGTGRPGELFQMRDSVTPDGKRGA